MWIVTLIAKRDSLIIEDKMTFEFESAIEVTNFIEKAVKSFVGKVEVNIKFEDDKGEDEE